MKSNPIEDQYVVRLYSRERDLPGLVQLRAEIEAFDQAGNDVSEAAVLASLNWIGHDPEHDRWIVENPEEQGKLRAHAWARSQSQERTIVYVAVHPDWRRKGLGSALLARTLARAHESGAAHVTAGADAKNKGADAFLLRHGFQHAGDNRFMRAPAGIALQEPRWPEGYTLRAYAEVQELSTLVEAFNRSYGDMWGHLENTAGAMNEEYLTKLMDQYPDWFIPEGIFIAFAPDGDVAGVCVAKLGPAVEGNELEREKIVDSAGVVPEHRHMRLQRPLTLTAMHWLRSHGSGPINLESYGDGLDAIEIYRDLGFVPEEHYIEYCRYLNVEEAE
ncbi:MAG: GNAT family N-acetyltransferase [Chloroflexota bacterium]